MNKKEFDSISRMLMDCDNYLAGRKSSDWIIEIAEHGAKRAVIERKESIYDRLREAGLPIDEEV